MVSAIKIKVPVILPKMSFLLLYVAGGSWSCGLGKGHRTGISYDEITGRKRQLWAKKKTGEVCMVCMGLDLV